MKEQHMPDWCEAEDWCPVTVTAELLGRKWHPVIVHRLLQKGPMGFNDLKREVHQISDKVLSESLDDLQEKNIVKKKIVGKKPKEVEYSLTEIGKSLKPVIIPMLEWGRENASKL